MPFFEDSEHCLEILNYTLITLSWSEEQYAKCMKLYIQIWKYFHSIILGSVGRGCSK